MIGVGTRRRSSKVKDAAPAEVAPAADSQEAKEQFIERAVEIRDYGRAVTYIQFLIEEMGVRPTLEMRAWMGYSHFHMGNYEEALAVYEKLLEENPSEQIYHLFMACCHYYLEDFQHARLSAERGPVCDLRSRLLFMVAFKNGDMDQLISIRSQLVGTVENQLAMAAVDFMRADYTAAMTIYERVLQNHSEYLAIHAYIAMCQFRMDQFDTSNESVDAYLGANSDSAIGLNLKACDYLKLFGAEIAESQLLQIRKFCSASYYAVEPLVKHNLIVFADGEGGFQSLPRLFSVVPEARFNVATLHMRDNNPVEAHALVATQPVQENDVPGVMLRAAVMLGAGQVASEPSMVDEAGELLRRLGERQRVKDTVAGRQALAVAKMIQGDSEGALKFLQTIEKHVGETDEFSYNKAMCYAALGRWAEAERSFTLVKNPKVMSDVFYTSWLCRCYIRNRKPEDAWRLYIETTAPEHAKTLLQIIAADCFVTGSYYYAMRAYEILNKCDNDPSYRTGMIAASVGVFRAVLSRKEPPERVQEVLTVLQGEPEAAQVVHAIRGYTDDVGL